MTKFIRITFLILQVSVITSHSKASPKKHQGFSMEKEPKQADWSNFFESSKAAKAQMWNKLVKDSKGFKKLHWGWRMAWVKTCTFENDAYCRDLLKQALLEDKALVVRAEAASRIGDRFEKSKDKNAVDLLNMAYLNKGNTRNNSPLFIQTRILDSLYKIGGQHAIKIGAKLALTGDKTKSYWKKRAKNLK